MTIKEKVFALIDGGDGPKSLSNKIIDITIVAFITLSVVQIILESFQPINDRYGDEFWLFEIFVVIIFTIEYLLRLWIADLTYPELPAGKARLKFVFSGIGLIDLLAILPFYLPFLITFDLRFIRILRVVRLLRVFKLNRYHKAIKSGLIAILGIGLVALPTGIISAAFIEQVEEDIKAKSVEEQEEKGFTFCPHCGERLKSE